LPLNGALYAQMSILKYLASQLKLVKDDIKFRKLNSSSTGVYLSDKKLFKWADVTSIEAYKRDMVTEDLICLDIFLSAGTIVTLHEELNGFEDFKTMMHQQLYLNNKDWMVAVMLPPFEECRTQVYKCI
jgi:hypothetical protein